MLMAAGAVELDITLQPFSVRLELPEKVAAPEAVPFRASTQACPLVMYLATARAVRLTGVWLNRAVKYRGVVVDRITSTAVAPPAPETGGLLTTMVPALATKPLSAAALAALAVITLEERPDF